MPKTIRQLAENLGVSKTAINKLLTPKNRQLYVKKVGNRFLISDEGVKLITAHFSDKNENQSSTKVADIENNDDDKVFDFNKELLATLKSDLDEKNKQLAAKDEQLNTLHTLLDQQQRLTLQANKQIEKLESQLRLPEGISSDDGKEISNTNSKTSQTKSQTSQTKSKTHWWQRKSKKEAD